MLYTLLKLKIFNGYTEACKKARQLVDTFNNSNQLSESLQKIQLQNEVKRPKKLIQDACTR